MPNVACPNEGRDTRSSLTEPEYVVHAPRTSQDDPSRAAFVDALRIKHGLVFKHRRGSPRHMTVTAAHHGVSSLTFFRFAEVAE
jgi:hypothetical protein